MLPRCNFNMSRIRPVARAALGAGVAVTLTHGEIDESARTIFGEQGALASGPHVDRVAEAGNDIVTRATRRADDAPALLRFGRDLARDPAVQRAVLAHSGACGLMDDPEQLYARSDEMAELKRSVAELKSDLEDQQDLNCDLILFQDRLMSKNDSLASEVRELRAALPSPPRAANGAANGAAAAAQGAVEIDVSAMLLAEATDENEDELEGGPLAWVRPSLERVRRKRAAVESRGEWLVAAGVGIAAAIVLFAVFRRRIAGAASTKVAAKLAARATAAMLRFVGR